jgi:hypothetical protein
MACFCGTLRKTARVIFQRHPAVEKRRAPGGRAQAISYLEKSLDELRSVLQADLENHRAEMASPLPGQRPAEWKDMDQAIALLEKSPEEFLLKFFKEVLDQASKGPFSVTSR